MLSFHMLLVLTWLLTNRNFSFTSVAPERAAAKFFLDFVINAASKIVLWCGNTWAFLAVQIGLLHCLQ